MFGGREARTNKRTNKQTNIQTPPWAQDAPPPPPHPPPRPLCCMWRLWPDRAKDVPALRVVVSGMALNANLCLHFLKKRVPGPIGPAFQSPASLNQDFETTRCTESTFVLGTRVPTEKSTIEPPVQTQQHFTKVVHTRDSVWRIAEHREQYGIRCNNFIGRGEASSKVRDQQPLSWVCKELVYHMWRQPLRDLQCNDIGVFAQFH